MANNVSIVGTVIKINVHFDKIDELSMSDYNFLCKFYVHPNKNITVRKDEMIRIDDDNYIAVIDTEKIGSGEIIMRVTAMIPDDDCPVGIRKEVTECSTGIIIKK